MFLTALLNANIHIKIVLTLHLHILFRIFIAKKSAIKLYRHIIFIKPSISKKTPGSFTDLTRFYLIKQLVSVCCRFFLFNFISCMVIGLDSLGPYQAIWISFEKRAFYKDIEKYSKVRSVQSLSTSRAFRTQVRQLPIQKR